MAARLRVDRAACRLDLVLSRGPNASEQDIARAMNTLGRRREQLDLHTLI